MIRITQPGKLIYDLRANLIILKYTGGFALPGFRKYKDLNGARWFMQLATDPDILRVDEIDLYVGSERGIANDKFLILARGGTSFSTLPHAPLKENGRGSYSGELIIPANYF